MFVNEMIEVFLVLKPTFNCRSPSFTARWMGNWYFGGSAINGSIAWLFYQPQYIDSTIYCTLPPATASAKYQLLNYLRFTMGAYSFRRILEQPKPHSTVTHLYFTFNWVLSWDRIPPRGYSIAICFIKSETILKGIWLKEPPNSRGWNCAIGR